MEHPTRIGSCPQCVWSVSLALKHGPRWAGPGCPFRMGQAAGKGFKASVALFAVADPDVFERRAEPSPNICESNPQPLFLLHTFLQRPRGAIQLQFPCNTCLYLQVTGYLQDTYMYLYSRRWATPQPFHQSNGVEVTTRTDASGGEMGTKPRDRLVRSGMLRSGVDRSG